MSPDLGMAGGLILLTGVFRTPYARPSFVAMGLVVILTYLAIFDGHRHGYFSGIVVVEVENPYLAKQALVVVLLGIAFVRRRSITSPFLRTLLATSAAAVLVSTLFMLTTLGYEQLSFGGMAYGASVVLTFGVLASRRLATAPLPGAVVRQPDTGLVARLRSFAQLWRARSLQSGLACAPTGCRSTPRIPTTPSRPSSPGGSSPW
ncbi:hypothetical protein BH11MYX3_BH11MYX3_22930 [soil metagenome]